MYVMVFAALLLTEPHRHKSSTDASSAMFLAERCTESIHEQSTNVTLHQYLQRVFTTSLMANNNLGQIWSRPFCKLHIQSTANATTCSSRSVAAVINRGMLTCDNAGHIAILSLHVLN